MQNITSVATLKNAIQLLKVEQAAKEQLLREHFHQTYQSLRPVNILRTTIQDITSSPWLIENLIGTTLGLVTGYLSKEIVVGKSVNRFRKLIGSVLQFGVTNLLLQHAEDIKSFGQSVLQSVFRKKEHIPHAQSE
jgi:hypothetical protein